MRNHFGEFLQPRARAKAKLGQANDFYSNDFTNMRSILTRNIPWLLGGGIIGGLAGWKLCKFVHRKKLAPQAPQLRKKNPENSSEEKGIPVVLKKKKKRKNPDTDTLVDQKNLPPV